MGTLSHPKPHWQKPLQIYARQACFDPLLVIPFLALRGYSGSGASERYEGAVVTVAAVCNCHTPAEAAKPCRTGIGRFSACSDGHRDFPKECAYAPH